MSPAVLSHSDVVEGVVREGTVLLFGGRLRQWKQEGQSAIAASDHC
jgi:hypothetical protein